MPVAWAGCKFHRGNKMLRRYRKDNAIVSLEMKQISRSLFEITATSKYSRKQVVLGHFPKDTALKTWTLMAEAIEANSVPF